MNHCDLLIENARIASMAEDGRAYGLIEDGAVAVSDGRIDWIGPQAQQPACTAKERVDAGGRLLTPGLIDCHTHLVFAGARAGEFEQRLKGVSYSEIAAAGGGIQASVQATRAADEASLVANALPRLQHLMDQGVMAVEIKSGYGLDLASELKMLRAAGALGSDRPVQILRTFLGAHAVPPEHRDSRGEYVNLLCQEMIPRIAREGLADAVDVYCEGIGFSEEETRAVFDAACRWNLPVKCHADQLSLSGGAALVAEYGGLSADHVEYSDAAAVRAMAEHGVVATLLPYAFYALNETRKPPVALFRKHGVPMAVATDCNPGTAPTTHILMCLHMACTLFSLTVEEAFAGVTRNAARALGLNDVGSLEVGHKARMVLWQARDVVDLVYWQGANPVARLFFAP